MPSPAHEAIVARIVKQYGASERGFTEAVVDAVVWSSGLSESEVRDEVEISGFLKPDAFVIDRAAREITIWEVEVSHPRFRAKARGWAEAWFYLDCEEWLLRLVCVGELCEQIEVDLQATYYHVTDVLPAPKDLPFHAVTRAP